MTATVQAPGGAPAPSRAARGWLRRHRAAVLVGAALVVAVVLAVVGSGGQQFSGALDPENPSPTGARAVARVLADQGIEVDVVRDAEAFADAEVDARTTVLVTSTEALGRTTARQILEQGRDADVVVVEPGFGIAELFGTGDGTGYSRTRKVASGCTDPRFSGLTLETRAGAVFPASDEACFPEGPGALLAPTTSGVTVLGAADLLSNEQVSRSDNAAVALRLLGQHERLVWYVPDPADLTGDDGVSFRSLLPTWLGPAFLLLCVAVLALIGWRGRRLGPLATEPLPVTVTAIETTRSRGRLYRKADDRGYAADALRRSTRHELVEHLLLPRHAADDVDLLVRVLPAYTTRTAGELRDLLGPAGPAPASDRDLIALAENLAALSREVRSS